MKRIGSMLLVIALLGSFGVVSAQQTDNPVPPDDVVKLIFIHHSTGENWLTDGYGNLGRTLDQNNYFVSDTNYGWGPDAIGDRTDIPNWVEWFSSENTPTYMAALFNEHEQHAFYTRTLSDPGGENVIVMFKSCFPNSALAGSPNDPPTAGYDFTVGNAKFVYNEILKYFQTRPDKLFVVITAPPLSDGEYANNARAFNEWLINNWLDENNYPYANVAVFDFYNILTDKNAHHRFANEQVEHILGNRNTLYYPSGDDHPSEAGSQKATDEFIPMLNVFYHRWKASAPESIPPAATSAPVIATQSPNVVPPAQIDSILIDDFESEPPSGSNGWEGFFQDGTDTMLTCAVDSDQVYAGTKSLKFDFDLTPNSWATCGFYFDEIKNWSAGQGISFYIRADQPGLSFDVDVYGGTPGGRSLYVHRVETTLEWARVDIRWDEILRAEWEENAGAPFDPSAVTGFSIGLASPESARMIGAIWIDNVQLLSDDMPLAGVPSIISTESVDEQPENEPTAKNPLLPCAGALLPLLGMLFALLWRR